MTNQPQFDVFLAHNSQDKPQVRAIARELRQRGLKYWIDEEQIPPGRSFQDVIQQAIPLVKSAAIFIGLGGLGKWQAWELKAFISQCVEADIPVIPVLLPEVERIPEHLRFLRELNWVRFANGIDDVEALDNLEWGITGHKPQRDAKNRPMLENKSIQVQPTKGIEVFFGYSRTHKDKKLRDSLEKRLSGLSKQGIITCWHDGKIGAGKNEEHEINIHLNAARVILLLISPDFMDWYHSCDSQVRRTMERYEAGEASVIPVLLQQVDWSGTEFSQLRPLPSNREFVDSRYWKNQNEAFFSITNDLRIEVEELDGK
jgi:hypothetical protein